MCTVWVLGALIIQIQKRVLYPLELELQMVEMPCGYQEQNPVFWKRISVINVLNS